MQEMLHQELDLVVEVVLVVEPEMVVMGLMDLCTLDIVSPK
tara:strand:- start:7 stop:129 length:123 start_codon:yes stop_codon:yes gene_type:complete